jgi:hypothetical protein
MEVYRNLRFQLTRGEQQPSAPVRIVALALLRFIPGVEKTPNHLREVSLERANQNKWNIDKTVPSVAFHKLCNTAISIDMHHNKKAAPVFDLYDLTQEGDF